MNINLTDHGLIKNPNNIININNSKKEIYLLTTITNEKKAEDFNKKQLSNLL
ncbi:MAG: hypothetical protein RCG15_04195 [Candidatus Rickettsia vulgarisii]